MEWETPPIAIAVTAGLLLISLPLPSFVPFQTLKET